MDRPAAAIDMLERAFALNTQDARVLFELDQLKKKLGVPHAERLSFLAQYWQQVASRDDLYLEYATLQNCLERYEEALTLLLQRHFYPWEGGWYTGSRPITGRLASDVWSLPVIASSYISTM